MSKEFTLTPQPADDNLAAFEIARGEGWYGLAVIAQNDDDRERAMFNLNDALERAEALGDKPYDQENEFPFVAPDAAIYGLRMALRALLASDGTKRDAIEAVARALVTIENPE